MTSTKWTSSSGTGTVAAPAAVRASDLYETPTVATQALLEAEKSALPIRIWEPAAGKGAMQRVLALAGYRVIAFDLHDYDQPGIIGGVDFF